MQLSKRSAVVASALVAAAVASLGTASASAGGPATPCRPGRAKLIAADTQVVVYVGHVRERRGPTYAAYLGCLRGGRRAYEVGGPGVGSSSGAGGTRNLTLSGPIVAWEQWESTGVTGESGREKWFVLVRDLRTGRVLQKVPTGTATVRGWVGVGPTQQIVVSSDGGVAWIAAVAGPTTPQNMLEVHVADRSGSRVLAAGSDIAPDSLALAGHTAYWTQGGKPATAALN